MNLTVFLLKSEPVYYVSFYFKPKLEIRSVEHGICPIAEFTSP